MVLITADAYHNLVGYESKLGLTYTEEELLPEIDCGVLMAIPLEEGAPLDREQERLEDNATPERQQEWLAKHQKAALNVNH